MEEYSLPFAVSALGDMIAAQVENDEELAVLAAVFTQLGDTLATILTVRALGDRSKTPDTGQEGSSSTRCRRRSCS